MPAPDCRTRRSSTRPEQQSLPCIPAQDDKRQSAITPNEQQVIVRQPPLQHLEAAALAARLDLADQWPLGIAEDVNVDVGAAAAVPASATIRNPLCVNAQGAVQVNDFKLSSTPL